eukprot:10676761-Alexandrium_andersonii.AAC.1
MSDMRASMPTNSDKWLRQHKSERQLGANAEHALANAGNTARPNKRSPRPKRAGAKAETNFAKAE